MELRNRKKESETKERKKQTSAPAKHENNLGICKKILIFDLAILIILVLGYIFSPIKAQHFTGWVNVPLSGPFAPNTHLRNFVK